MAHPSARQRRSVRGLIRRRPTFLGAHSGMVRWFAYVCGVIALVVGVRSIVKRSVEVGIEGRTPAFVLRGSVAVLLGVIAMLIGVCILWNPDILP